MTSNDENRDEVVSELAGEYVLGTLDEVERVAVEARLQREPALAEAVRVWREKLAPLDEAIEQVEPPSGQLDRVFAIIDTGHEDSNGAEIIQLRRRARIWRVGAIATGAIAAALAFMMVFTNLSGPQTGGGPAMVALLESKDSKLVYLASTDAKSGMVVLKRMGAGPASGKSHELWAIGGGRDKPQSLGVINARAEIPVDRIGLPTAEYLQEITLAVSLEPEGGSPTGQPTGPVLFTGKFMALPTS